MTKSLRPADMSDLTVEQFYAIQKTIEAQG